VVETLLVQLPDEMCSAALLDQTIADNKRAHKREVKLLERTPTSRAGQQW
jgi:hypothetical protein